MPQDLSVSSAHMVKNVLRLLRPHKLVGASKVRTGRFFDGGYVMLDRFEGVQAAYSLGINDDVSWDLDMARRGIPVYQYDHTIEGLPEEHELFHWEPKCISGIGDEENGVETLEGLMAKNGHSDYDNMILKCDIEESEWLLLEKTPNSVLRKFSQIVIELHNMAYLTDTYHGNNVRRAIANLTSSHRVVHVHANNFAQWSVIGGIPVPAVLEVSLVRTSEGELVQSDEVFPTAMDMPCHAGEADMYLGRFEFL